MIVKIAFRNIFYHRGRSLLIGLALFISTFCLLLSNAAMNGIETQVIDGYVNYQSGHVAVLWSGMDDVSRNDPSRFLQNLVSFDPEQETENLAAIRQLEQFMTENGKVEYGFPAVLRLGNYIVGDQFDQILVFGLTDEHAQFLTGAGTLEITEGVLPAESPGVVVSEFVAGQHELRLGDDFSIRTQRRSEF